MFPFKLDPQSDRRTLKRKYIFRTTLDGLVTVPLLLVLWDWLIGAPENFLTLPYFARVLFVGVFGGLFFGFFNFPFAYRHMRRSRENSAGTVD